LGWFFFALIVLFFLSPQWFIKSSLKDFTWKILVPKSWGWRFHITKNFLKNYLSGRHIYIC
jgi:hypothetical protein